MNKIRKILFIISTIAGLCITGCFSDGTTGKESINDNESTSVTTTQESITVIHQSISKDDLGSGFKSISGEKIGRAVTTSGVIFSTNSVGNYNTSPMKITAKEFKSNHISAYMINNEEFKNRLSTLDGKVYNELYNNPSDYTAIIEYRHIHGTYSLTGLNFISDAVNSDMYINTVEFEKNYGDVYLNSVNVGIISYIVVKVKNTSSTKIDEEIWKRACYLKINELYSGKTITATSDIKDIADKYCSVSAIGINNAEEVFTEVEMTQVGVKEYMENVINKFKSEDDYKVISERYISYPTEISLDKIKYVEIWQNLECGVLQIKDKSVMSNEEYQTLYNKVHDALIDIVLNGAYAISNHPMPAEIRAELNKYITNNTITVTIVDSNGDYLYTTKAVIEKDGDYIVRTSGTFEYLAEGVYSVYPEGQPESAKKVTIDSSKSSYTVTVTVK